MCQFFFTHKIKSTVNFVKQQTAQFLFCLHIVKKAKNNFMVLAKRAMHLLNTYAMHLHGVFLSNRLIERFVFH